VDDVATYNTMGLEGRFAEIPVVGSIAVDTPVEMFPVDETFPCPVCNIDRYGENLYYLRVVGNSVNHIIPRGP
jgi:hypothetical protein